MHWSEQKQKALPNYQTNSEHQNEKWAAITTSCAWHPGSYPETDQALISFKLQRRVALIRADCLSMIWTCWQSVSVNNTDSSYLQSFTNLSASGCSQFELDHDCLEHQVTCPFGLRLKVIAQRLNVLPAQPLGDHLVTATCGNWFPKMQSLRYHFFFFLTSCEIAILLYSSVTEC